MTDANVTKTAAVHSERHGGHWVAWVTDATGRPVESMILVGQTQEEAEARARAWAQARGA